MNAYCDNEPKRLEKVGNGSYRYRWNIEKEERTGEDGSTTTGYTCEEVTVWEPISSNKITKAVLTEKWDVNQEQKLMNEYNAAQLGLLEGEEAEQRIAAYKEYLTGRTALKAEVDATCAELGIK